MPTVIMSPTVEDWNSLCCLKGQDQEQYVEIMGNISYFDIEEEVMSENALKNIIDVKMRSVLG